MTTLTDRALELDPQLHRASNATLRPIYQSGELLYPLEDRDEVRVQTAFYQGRARDYVARYLARLGAGIRHDPSPLQSGLLRHVVDSLSVLYRSPPTRYLRRRGQRVGDDDTSQQIAWRMYSRSGLDAMLREADRCRALWRTCFARLYPSDVARRVRLNLCPPTSVYRIPRPGEEDDVRADEAIAIVRSDGSAEAWTRQDDGWTLEVYDRQGELVGEPESWTVLPIVALYDSPGQAYVPPYQWRSEYLMKIALTTNEIGAAVLWDVHPRAFFVTPTAPPSHIPRSPPPTAVGPGEAAILPVGMDFRLAQLSPQIGAIGAATQQLIDMWYRAESLPTESFRSSQSVSALGLEVLASPLRERREDMAPFALEVERQLWDAYRYLHNVHAARWGLPWIDASLELDVELGRVDVPRDPTARVDYHSRLLALELESRVDAAQDLHDSPDRPAALARLAQVRTDAIDYGSVDARPVVQGAQPADPAGAPNRLASTIGAARDAQGLRGGDPES